MELNDVAKVKIYIARARLPYQALIFSSQAQEQISASLDSTIRSQKVQTQRQHSLSECAKKRRILGPCPANHTAHILHAKQWIDNPTNACPSLCSVWDFGCKRNANIPHFFMGTQSSQEISCSARGEIFSGRKGAGLGH
jgi:hypothetical protein